MGHAATRFATLQKQMIEFYGMEQNIFAQD